MKTAEEIQAEILRLDTDTLAIQRQAKAQYDLVPTARDGDWDGDAAVRQCRANMAGTNKLNWVLDKTAADGLRQAEGFGPIVITRETIIERLCKMRLVGDMERFGGLLPAVMKEGMVYSSRQEGTFDQFKWMPSDNPVWKRFTTSTLWRVLNECMDAQQRFV